MHETDPELARVLRANRWKLGEALLGSLANWDKYAAMANADAATRTEFVRLEMLGFVDYLAIYFERGDVSYRDLYIGEKLKQCHDPGDSEETSAARKLTVTARDKAIFAAELGPLLDTARMGRLLGVLGEVERIVTGQSVSDVGRRRMKVLFIGDCLHLDVVAFLTAPLLESGITLQSSFATSKNPVELQRFLRGMQEQVFDLVFYSPYSYAFDLEYSQLQFMRGALAGPVKWRGMVESAKKDSAGVLRLVGELFEAPIFVHNSANVRRHDRSLLERAKNAVTAPARRYARKRINAWLPGKLEELNAATFRHFFLLDEMALLAKQSEDALGSLFYDSDLQHPAAFGRSIAAMYEDAVIAQALYAKKKVIVCDLDNTLWNGVIGEGRVEHFVDRQQTLKRLRNKGVLLAINSKNDPKNVRWDGGLLGEDDFVSSQINWGSKVLNLRRIAEDLNLKLKDFLFVDDRSDERAMVTELLPEVGVLDAESPEMWRRLALVAEMLPEQDELDRTLAYKQREQRQSFLEDPTAAAEEQRAMFLKLKLKLTIREAELKELKRVAELVNRTNQFNLCGSRTTLKEVTEWHNDPRRSVFVVEAADRFGSMGVVSVAVVAETDRAVEIPVFVLSCRVFGYGVEKALINHVRRMASESQDGRVVSGLYLETPHNEPCRTTYPDAGFAWDGNAWVHRNASAIEDPDWLAIEAPQMAVPR